MTKHRLWIFLIIISIFGININSVFATPNLDSGSKIIFGGITVDVNETYENTEDYDNLPSIAHIFTATWCNPCVDVEHAIEDVANNTKLEMLSFHRFAGETEDPFGTENSENWWKEWFNDSLPLQPTAIINGVDSFIGAKQGSYENIFEVSKEKPTINNNEKTTIIHTQFDSQTSVFEWNITNSNVCENIKTFVHFVEESAYFPNGTNGLKNYTHIVHHVKELDGASGTADLTQEISQISPYDGDDLKLKIVFGCITFNPDNPNIIQNENSDLSYIGFLPTTLIILGSALVYSNRYFLKCVD